ncbi:alpha-amylase [Rhodospirillum rubrum]|uniref:alpha-amylase family glycosyl hydrolase n=1 Tax=Rhodospirillum rubrum TaxID=1085 RepID=UPI001904B9CC|nr:alpha-amylase family glycosyl hydrolase [Rhodospirillum rubrum]MBK1666277.1 alpha-amylase [Rhodospirillum rubrum]MBK1677140.1 alpha-amylase [Rhodospirillum rubrum]
MSGQEWWKRAVIYQIYPRSFQDADGDGIGDLVGIAQRLNYLSWLGVDAIWISPFYPSPMKDFGYDIQDYRDVDPIFGTLADFDALAARARDLGLKLILDFVPNHTSDRHPWFLESRQSPASAKRDWYIWRDPAADGGPPTNWLAEFGGSAWEYDEASGQYYYHAFLKEQPDLNWRNPDVRAAMYDAMHFWLERGVDGFRVDVMWHLIKDDQFRDNPPNPARPPNAGPANTLIPLYTADRPEVHDIVGEMRAVVDAYPERVLIGEIWLPTDRLVTYYGHDLRGAHLPFNFQLIGAAWDAGVIKEIVGDYEKALPRGGWPNWVMGNHDKGRIASRLGPRQARLAMLLLLTLRGTPTLYYGDEIAMRDVPIPPDRVCDPYEKNVPGLGLGRDPERTPMQWDSGPQAGFTHAAQPWLPIAADASTVNVAAQRDAPASMLTLVHRLIALRKAEAALAIGDYGALDAPGQVVMFLRRVPGRRLLVALNLGEGGQSLSLPEDCRGATVLLSTDPERPLGDLAPAFTLGEGEGIVALLVDLETAPPSPAA